MGEAVLKLSQRMRETSELQEWPHGQEVMADAGDIQSSEIDIALR